jgi:hypothetical protein
MLAGREQLGGGNHSGFETRRVPYLVSIALGGEDLWHVPVTVRADSLRRVNAARGVLTTTTASGMEVNN